MKVLIESTMNFSEIPFRVINEATYTSRRLDNAHSTTSVKGRKIQTVFVFSCRFTDNDPQIEVSHGPDFFTDTKN